MSSLSVISPDILHLDPLRETEKITAAVCDQVFHQLKRKGAVIGVSGGIDSTVVAYLCARALGKERVVLLFTPEADSKVELVTILALHPVSHGAGPTRDRASRPGVRGADSRPGAREAKTGSSRRKAASSPPIIWQ